MDGLVKRLCPVWAFIFACANLVIFGPGVMGEIDFWAAVGIVVFALIEVVLFIWVFGPDRAWNEINQGADIKLPRVVFFVLKYITPVYLAGLVIAWLYQDGKAVALMQGVNSEEVPWRWAARALMLAVLLGLVYLIKRSRHLKEDEVGGSKLKQ